VADVLRGCDFGGFNVTRYDAPLLVEEFARAGVPFSLEGRRILDAQRIYHLKEPRDLTAALKFYCGEDHDGAHGALDDAEATLRVLEAQLERYDDLPRDIELLAALCNPRDPTWADTEGKIRWRDGDLIINFGQKQGLRLKDLVLNNRGYLEWILKSDFAEDTKELVRDAINHRTPTPPA
jgi:DNA polymerase-3 subunit epsilon